MAIICPTVTAYNVRTYRMQIERIAKFAHRIHLDLMDGHFTPKASPDMTKIWWPVGVKSDIHVMYKDPNDYIDTLIMLKPDLVIIHAEADGDFYDFQSSMKAAGIKVGLAVLKQTPISQIEPVLSLLDHVLIFSGELGKFGGRVNFELLNKVREVKAYGHNIEVGWDGGVNQHNIKQLTEGGVDVLNVGGYIQRSENPEEAYAILETLVGNQNAG